MPNCAARSRIASPCSRAAATSASRGGASRVRRVVRRRAARVIARRRGRARARGDRQRRACSRALDRACCASSATAASSTWSSTGSSTSRATSCTDSQIRVHLYAALARARHGDSVPASRAARWRPTRAPGGTTREGAAQRVGDARRGSTVRAADRRRARARSRAELDDCTLRAQRRDLAPGRGRRLAVHPRATARSAIYGDAATAPACAPRLATLEAPAYFGEMGLLTGQARTANVVADDDVLCYRLTRRASTRSCGRARSSSTRCRRSSRSGRRRTTRRCRRVDADARARHGGRAARRELVRKIRQFFDIASVATAARRRTLGTRQRPRPAPRASAGTRCPRTDGVASHTNGSRGNAASTRGAVVRRLRRPACRRGLRKRGASLEDRAHGVEAVVAAGERERAARAGIRRGSSSIAIAVTYGGLLMMRS